MKACLPAWGILLTVLAASAAAQNNAGPQPADKGPMRIEAASIYDTRVNNIAADAEPRESICMINARLIGPRIGEIIRLGSPIVDEMLDSTGKALIDPGQFTPMQRDRTRQYSIPQGAVSQGYINMRIQLDQSPAREADKIATARGYLWVVYGGEAEPVYLPHPEQYLGKYIEHPRFKDLGIRVRMLTPAEAPELDGTDNSFALAIEAGEDKIRNITVFDEWLRNTNTRVRPIREGERRYNVYTMVTGRFHDDCELGIYVFPAVERQKVEFEWKDLELP